MAGIIAPTVLSQQGAELRVMKYCMQTNISTPMLPVIMITHFRITVNKWMWIGFVLAF